MSNKIILLGSGTPSETTFSALAYRGMTKLLSSLPRFDNFETETIEAPSNASIIPTLIEHPGAFAVLPIETAAGGKIDESLMPVARLGSLTTIAALLAYRLRISFCLYARDQLELSELQGVLGHPRALQACEEFITTHGLQAIPVDNNATAAHLVRTNGTYKQFGALGPENPRTQLTCKHRGCEDAPAYTTFLLLHHGKGAQTPKTHKQCMFRTLVAFNVDNVQGALHQAIGKFKNWNMLHIISVYESTLFGYRFIIELECSHHLTARLTRKLTDLQNEESGITRLAFLGPYPLITSDR